MRPSGFVRRVDWREAGSLAALAVGIVYLWHSSLLYPLRILVVFFHELSHALAAILTGGGVQSIYLHPGAGGLCVTTGGVPFIVISAGYLGSLFWGGMIMLASRKVRWVNTLTAGLGILLLGSAALVVRPLLDFGFFFCVGTGAALVGMGLKLPVWMNGFALRLIGLSSSMYAVMDIKADILDRPHITSDATLLAELTGISAWVWGVFWMLSALVCSAVFLVVACTKSQPGKSTALRR